MTIGEETQGYEQAAAEANADTTTDNVVTSSDTVPTESAQSGNTEASTTVWNGEQFAFDHNGQRIIPKSLDELKLWAMRGRNVSQRNAELNKRQQEVEETSKKLAEYQKLADAFDQNPEFKKQIMDLYVKSQQGETTPQEDRQLQQLPPEIKDKLGVIDNLRSETQTLKEEFENIKKEKEDQLLEQEITALKNKYKDVNWDEDDGEGSFLVKVMKEAMETGLSLEKCYKILSYDQIRTNTEAQTIRESTERELANKKKGIISSVSDHKPQPKAVDISNTPYSKLAEAAIAEMK
jgi:hypothetical protein